MASWRSSSSRRSSSPASPLSPIPPHNLPQWLRTTGKSSAVIPPGKLKVLIAAFTCILLGYLMTSALAPQVQKAPEDVFDNTRLASTGVLNNPTGYGKNDDVTANSATPLSGLDLDDSIKHGSMSDKQDYGVDADQGPSIKGALGDLHKAVSDKIHGWSLHDKTKGGKTKTNTSTAMTTMTKSNTSESIKELSEEERLGARTRIGKCTILFNGNSYWERAIKTHEVHDRLHNYRLHVLRQDLLDDVWSKPAYILSLLLRELAKPEGERLEWLFWVDADTIILNPYVSIETFLPPADFENIHLLYSEDWNGLNNGVFPIRVNKWAVELFSAIITYRYYRPDGDLTFRDQSAMNTLMRERKFVKNVMKLPQRWFNAYQGEHNETLAPYQTRRGDFLVHFAGVVDREPRMSFWLDRAEQHLDDWEVPLKSTSYIQEVRDFWGEQRVARESHKNGLSEARLAATTVVTNIDELMADFAERLSTEQIDTIKIAQTNLSSFLGDEIAAEDLEQLNAKSKELEDAALPLTAAKIENHKVLLSSAHDAIFASEKELLEAGFNNGITSPDLNELDDVMKKLKEMVLANETSWNRASMTAAIDAVTVARGRVQERTANVAAAAASASAALSPAAPLASLASASSSPSAAAAGANLPPTAGVAAAAMAQAAQFEEAAKKLAELRLKAGQSTPSAQAEVDDD